MNLFLALCFPATLKLNQQINMSLRFAWEPVFIQRSKLMNKFHLPEDRLF